MVSTLDEQVEMSSKINVLSRSSKLFCFQVRHFHKLRSVIAGRVLSVRGTEKSIAESRTVYTKWDRRSSIPYRLLKRERNIVSKYEQLQTK